MKFRKIIKINFEDPAQQSLKFKNGEYAIYDGMDILHVREEDLSIRIIKTNGNFSAIYSTEWVSHPIKDEYEFEVSNSNPGEIEFSFPIQPGITEEAALEKEIINILSDIENEKKLKPHHFDSKIEMVSVGDNLYELTFGVHENIEGLLPYLQISIRFEDDDGVSQNLGFKLKLTDSSMNAIVRSVRLIKERMEEGKFHHIRESIKKISTESKKS